MLNLIIKLISLMGKVVSGIIFYIWGILTDVIKVMIAPFLAIWVLISPADEPPDNQSTEHVEEALQVEPNIPKQPVIDIQIEQYDMETNQIWVFLSITNNDLESINLSANDFKLIDATNNSYFAETLGNFQQKMIKSQQLEENETTQGWICFNYTDTPSFPLKLRFSYGGLFETKQIEVKI